MGLIDLSCLPSLLHFQESDGGSWPICAWIETPVETNCAIDHSLIELCNETLKFMWHPWSNRIVRKWMMQWNIKTHVASMIDQDSDKSLQSSRAWAVSSHPGTSTFHAELANLLVVFEWIIKILHNSWKAMAFTGYTQLFLLKTFKLMPVIPSVQSSITTVVCSVTL